MGTDIHSKPNNVHYIFILKCISSLKCILKKENIRTVILESKIKFIHKFLLQEVPRCGEGRMPEGCATGEGGDCPHHLRDIPWPWGVWLFQWEAIGPSHEVCDCSSERPLGHLMGCVTVPVRGHWAISWGWTLAAVCFKLHKSWQCINDKALPLNCCEQKLFW